MPLDDWPTHSMGEKEQNPVASSNILAKATNASHWYGKRQVLRKINLSLQQGEIYGLLGPNGAGKTTLMKALCGRLRLSSGSIKIVGRDPATSRVARQAISYVPQDIAIFPHLTVMENLKVFGRLAGVPRKSLQASIDALLVEAQLSKQTNQICKTLSGGYQRRVNICASILHKPSVLVLDEPTVGIDIEAREAIHGLLLARRQAGMAVLIATHDLDQAQALCDRIGLMQNGELITEGVPKQLLNETFGTNLEVIATLFQSPDQRGHATLQHLGFVATQSPLSWSGLCPEDGLDAHYFRQELSHGGVHLKELRIKEPDLSSLFIATLGNGARS